MYHFIQMLLESGIHDIRIGIFSFDFKNDSPWMFSVTLLVILYW